MVSSCVQILARPSVVRGRGRSRADGQGHCGGETVSVCACSDPSPYKANAAGSPSVCTRCAACLLQGLDGTDRGRRCGPESRSGTRRAGDSSRIVSVQTGITAEPSAVSQAREAGPRVWEPGDAVSPTGPRAPRALKARTQDREVPARARGRYSLVTVSAAAPSLCGSWGIAQFCAG